MLDRDTRTSILRLHTEGRGTRIIAEALGISRNAVKRTVRSGDAQPTKRPRKEQAEPYAERIVALYTRCEGNLVRVHEELAAEGVTLAYSTLTGFCRRAGIGVVPRKPKGQYVFAPGQEMQHDTSPHRVTVGGVERSLHCASLVLCHSRMIFAQCYPRWTRFWCKVFLTDALVAFGGAASQCMVDNSHVVILSGSGANAIMVPEMIAFGERYGFHFVAHEKGDAQRSGRVERAFHTIEHNFYPGRTFADLNDLNQQQRAWCDKSNATFKRALGAVPAALYALERTHLSPLPCHLPAVEQIHERIVDSEGYVSLHRNRYSVDLRQAPLGRSVSVHEGKERVRVFAGHKLVAEHERLQDGLDQRVTASEHRDPARLRPAQRPQPSEQERQLRAGSETLAAWLDAARARVPLNERSLRGLYRLWRDYPREVLEPVLARAQHYGLYDLDRIETMILRELRGAYFRIEPNDDDLPPLSQGNHGEDGHG